MGELEGEAESPRDPLTAGAVGAKSNEGSPKNSVGKGADGSSLNSYRTR